MDENNKVKNEQENVVSINVTEWKSYLKFEVIIDDIRINDDGTITVRGRKPYKDGEE